MKLLFIRPIITKRADYLEEEILKKFAAPNTEIKAVHIDWGVDSIENNYDLIHNAPFVVEKAILGEKEGYDGIVSYCFANPGVDAMREAVNVPCLGSGEAAVNLALNLGKKIAIITILPNIIPLIRNQNIEYIIIKRIVTIRSINVPVLKIYDDKKLYNKLSELAKKAILQDGADVLVLGCTGLAGMAQKLNDILLQNNINVPVVDPAGASVKVMEALIGNKLRHSKFTYMPPIKKTRKWLS